MTVNRDWTAAARRSSRRRFLRGSVGLTAGSAAAILLACSGDDKTEDTGSTTSSSAATGTTAAATGETPKRGGRLMLNIATTTNNNSPFTDWNQGFVLLGQTVYDRLLSTRPGKEYVLEAAQSVEVPDPTTVVFKLKPGLKYQDRAPVGGRAVSAEDVAKTQYHIRDNTRAVHRNFQDLYLQTAETPDSQTVVYRLKSPSAYLFSGTLLANGSAQCIVPAEQLDNIETAWPVGSGPYQLTEFEQNVRYVYRRFDGFREATGNMPFIDERQVTTLIDQPAQEAAFRSEQLHVWAVPNFSTLEPVRRDMGARIVVDEWPSLGMWTLALNGTKAPWNDVRVREAIYRLTNRQQYLDLISDGKGMVTPGTLSAGLSDYQLDPKETEKYWQQDPRAAKQLLDAAGFPYDKEVEMLVIQGGLNPQAGEIFQQQVSQAGMKARVVQMPFAEWLGSRVTPGNWETWVASHPAYDTPQIALRQQHTTTNSGHRVSGLKDPEVDKLIERSEVTLDRNERIKQVKDIQIQLLEKYTPFMFLFSPTVFQARWNFVQDWENNPATNPMYRVEAWMDK